MGVGQGGGPGASARAILAAKRARVAALRPDGAQGEGSGSVLALRDAGSSSAGVGEGLCLPLRCCVGCRLRSSGLQGLCLLLEKRGPCCSGWLRSARSVGRVWRGMRALASLRECLILTLSSLTNFLLLLLSLILLLFAYCLNCLPSAISVVGSLWPCMSS